MTQPSSKDGLPLPGLDGTNPLGFLAALGVLELISLEHRPNDVTMSWRDDDGTWQPVLYGAGTDSQGLAASLAKQLNCPFKPSADADSNRNQTQKAYDAKRSELKKIADDLKARGLRGADRKVADEVELGPIRAEVERLRLQWLSALRGSVSSLELSLGKHLNAPCRELREHMLLALKEASVCDRSILDLYAAFGSDACTLDKSDRMQATDFCFITGSGHQYFLDTVRQLVENVSADRLERAVFTQDIPQDEKFSMRWDPQEDRRYAVMWNDPTASGNKAKTNWPLNLLAYRGLSCLPSVPRTSGLSTTGWRHAESRSWSWPIWHGRITSRVVRSILASSLITTDKLERDELREHGVAAVYRSIRILVGNPPLHKINFTAAQRIA